MSRKLNHHFIPQYHFRIFTGGKRYVHLASRDGSRFVSFASIKGQCARHNFYGDEAVENWLGGLESRHAAVYRAIISIAWNARASSLSNDEDYQLREAILLQRARTPCAARIHASATDRMMLYAYSEYLGALPATPEREAIIKAIQCGEAKISDSLLVTVLIALRVASRAVPTITDLSLLILRNHTAIPFILGDAPCVFSNHYMRSIKDTGVLGYMTPGLMAVLPIDYRTQVLLYDADVYTPEYSTASCIDIFRISDVSILNALQLHAAEKNIFFSDTSAQAYIRELLSAHRRILQDHQGKFVVHDSGKVLIDGITNVGEVLHVFEPQLPITLDLSFISTASMRPNENPNRLRNPALARQIEGTLSLSNEPSPIKMEELAKWLEPRIHFARGI